jgi:hypothetical protein
MLRGRKTLTFMAAMVLRRSVLTLSEYHGFRPGMSRRVYSRTINLEIDMLQVAMLPPSALGKIWNFSIFRSWEELRIS